MGQALLLIQPMVILLTARGLAWLLRWIGQPPVIGREMFTLASADDDRHHHDDHADAAVLHALAAR